jgi:hypothetical protein
MSALMSPKTGGEILLYQTEDGRTRIQCRLEDETIWLTRAQIAELFQTTPQNVTLHLKSIFAEGELAEENKMSSSVVTRVSLCDEMARSLCAASTSKRTPRASIASRAAP